MGSLSKDTVDVANPAAEGAGAPTSAANKPTAALRQDALSLEVPVKVHGSRVTEVVRGVTPHTEPFEEQTSTMIIFPQGGVLRMSTSVNTGQMLVLTNLKTKQDAICRVVKVRTFSNMQGYVEVEFTHPQPTYWGVHFPGEKSAATAAKPAAAVPAAPAPAQPETKSKATTEVSWAPAKAAPVAPPAVKPPASDTAKQPSAPATAPPKPYVAPSKPASSFIGIGSQEEVQPAASATATTRAIPPVDPREVHEVAKPVSKEVVAAPPAGRSTPAAPGASEASSADAATVGFPSLTMTELLGDSEAADSSPEAQVARTFEEGAPLQAEKSTTPASTKDSAGAFAGIGASAATDTGRSAVSETFGSRFDSGAKAAGTDSGKGSPNWMLIAAAIGVLAVVVGGGAFYLRGQRGGAASATPSAPVASTAAPSATARPADVSTPQEMQPVAAAPSAAPPVATVGRAVVAPHGNNVAAATPSKPSASASAAAAKPSNNPAVVQPAPQPAGVTGNMVAQSLSAHPVTTQRSADEAVEAPSVDSAPSADSSGGALPSILSPGDGPPAPEPAPVAKSEAPVRVGGDVKEPRLISSPAPIYPVIAKQAHIQGDVVIKTTVDTRGNVAHMEVVSGPPMLRGSAMEALKRWKYSPSMLNGEPIAVQMMVTLKFRM